MQIVHLLAQANGAVLELLSTHPEFFPFIFVFFWLFVATLLSVVSGWFHLMRRFPDRTETPLRVFRHMSGTLGMVGMQGILKIEVCPSGLRFGINRLFGIFCSPFFVSWQNLSVIPTRTLGVQRTQLRFKAANGLVAGRLTMAPEEVARVRSASPAAIQAELFLPIEPNSSLGRRLLLQWILGTALAGLFFNLAPRYMFYFIPSRASTRAASPTAGLPPWYVLVLFPALVFGVRALISYVRFRQRTSSARSS